MRDLGVVAKVTGSRSTGTLAGSAQSLLHSFFETSSECQSAQEMLVVTVVELWGGVARRSGDKGGGGSERRSVGGERFQEVVGDAVFRDDGGVAQLTTPVQRIDRSRLG
ncbi:MAG: hypothetical protein HC833_25565 [Leptolyngbyaceae cyanobacterium RM1_406_9]|nr:hypothetical protein [Leptolyngbyaceae cyanobacterium RM1_406_9]